MHQIKRQLLLVGGATADAQAVAAALAGDGVVLESAPDREDARGALATEHFDVVFVWCRPNESLCRDLLDDIAETSPESALVAVASQEHAAVATALVQAGASDHLSVPFTPEEVRLVFKRALLQNQHAAQRMVASRAVARPDQQPEECPAMAEALATADRAARSLTTILIRGESGVGKEVLARRIHALSGRGQGPFIKVHCAALPEQILESELFGYEKGAFTGAATRKPGRFELAQGGTIFLDEIGDVSPSVQLKLLRVVQDREYERLGGTEVQRADVRILTATHRNLEKMVKTREFREDLYYRLNVLRITVPPLRERAGHVATLARQFCAEFGRAKGREIRFADASIDLLRSARWPGNVRQLQNVVERLVVLAESDIIEPADVERELERDLAPVLDETTEVSAVQLAAAVRQAERKALRRALDRSGGNRAQAARILGVSRRTLFYKLREYSLG
jgi:DNA-binding NtrC family response regulator